MSTPQETGRGYRSRSVPPGASQLSRVGGYLRERASEAYHLQVEPTLGGMKLPTGDSLFTDALAAKLPGSPRVQSVGRHPTTSTTGSSGPTTLEDASTLSIDVPPSSLLRRRKKKRKRPLPTPRSRSPSADVYRVSPLKVPDFSESFYVVQKTSASPERIEKNSSESERTGIESRALSQDTAKTTPKTSSDPLPTGSDSTESMDLQAEEAGSAKFLGLDTKSLGIFLLGVSIAQVFYALLGGRL